MRLRINIKGKPYDIEISEEEGKIKIKVGGKEFSFGREEEEKTSIAKTSLPKRNFSKKEIKAPVTGVVSKIFVKEGEFVKSDQKVLILSAMKMENEIISENNGLVKKIRVKENQSVNIGDVLIVLK